MNIETISAILILAGFIGWLIYRATRPKIRPDWNGAEPPREATAEEKAEFWRARASGDSET